MLDGYLSTLSAMNAAKARNALEMMVRCNGAARLMPRHELVEQRIANGAKLADTKHSGLVLQSPDGAFFDARNITKTGLDYAAFLLA